MSVRLHYDAAANAADLRFSGEPVVESEEVAPGIVLDYDAQGRMSCAPAITCRQTPSSPRNSEKRRRSPRAGRTS